MRQIFTRSIIASLGFAGLAACSQPPDNSAATITPAAAPVANAPQLQTAAPIIYLADNLDEKDKLGYCIDTLGRGFAEELQAHSCKPGGDAQDSDVQFSYDAASGQIRSAAYANKCAQLKDASAEVPFGLLDCDGNNGAQQFDYNAAAMTLHPRGQSANCLAAGAQSKTAGPFMSRPLRVAPCASVDASLKQWVVLGL